MIIGISHFVNFTKACDYYKGQGYDELTPAALESAMREKIEGGEITIGKPDVAVGERLLVIDDGCRYALQAAK